MLQSIWSQYFPPKPAFTEKNVSPGSQVGRVFIITGANQGIGFELLQMLYPSGATIYVAGRSKERCERAISELRATSPTCPSPAAVKYLHLDLSDLSSVQAAAESFAAQEEKLDILWNNAGVSQQPKGSTTRQGLEMHMGVNCVGPLMFTQALRRLLEAAAASASPGSVRVIWVGSLLIEQLAPKGGIDFARLVEDTTTDHMFNYSQSKVGNWFLGDEAAKRWGKDSIVSITANPGNLSTNAYAKLPVLVRFILSFVLYPPRNGGYTLLYSGLSEDVGLTNNGAYIWPWGRVRPNGRADIYQALSEGKGKQFWEWCENRFGTYTTPNRCDPCPSK